MQRISEVLQVVRPERATAPKLTARVGAARPGPGEAAAFDPDHAACCV